MSRRLAVEYTVKRRLYPWLAHPRADRRVFHVCQWKTASQWVQAVLSDPRAYRRHRLTCHAFGELFDRRHGGVPRLPDAVNGLFLSFFSTYEEIMAVGGDRSEAFVVVRHPIDVLVSWYVSTRYTHPPTLEVDQRREAMRAFDDVDGLRYMAERFHEQSDIPRSWLKAPHKPVFLRFEDLIIRKQKTAWEELSRLLSQPAHADAYLGIGRFYDRIIEIRSNPLGFAGSKYAPTTRIDRQDKRFLDLCSAIFQDYSDLFDEFGYGKP